MKRREFLLAGASVAGGLASPFAYGQTAKPCPPQTLGVEGGSQVTATCVASGTGPAWVRNLGVGSWGTIAAGSGSAKTLQQVSYYTQTGKTVNISFGNGSGGVNTLQSDGHTMLRSWTGGTVDADRKEYLICANGGHGDYPGNEAYAIALWDDTPYWYRLNDPTPSSLLDYNITKQVVPEGPYPGDDPWCKFTDGRGRSLHNGGTIFHVPGTGKIWFTMQNSFSSGSGNSGFGICSFNREYPGMASKATDVPLAWTNGPGPWSFPSQVGNSPAARGSIGAYYFGLGTYDSVTRKIWAVGGTQVGVYWNVDPFNNGYSQNFQRGDFPQVEPGWFQACPDRGVLIRGGTALAMTGRSPYEISIFNPATGQWVDKITGPAANFPWSDTRYIAHSSVYYGGSVYVMDPYFFGNRLFKLTLPRDLNGDWSNAWSVIQVPGGPTTSPNSTGTWGALQLIEFGSTAALVLPLDAGLPTYVYRLA